MSDTRRRGQWLFCVVEKARKPLPGRGRRPDQGDSNDSPSQSGHLWCPPCSGRTGGRGKTSEPSTDHPTDEGSRTEGALQAEISRNHQFKHPHPVAENLLDRVFTAEQPNQKWTTDITYLPVAEGWMYLAVVMDLFSRKIVGWAMRATLHTELVVAARDMAQQSRRPGQGLLHHSDQGVQYASHEYRQALERLKALQSMSRKGECWDNAAMESFFATLKLELEPR